MTRRETKREYHERQRRKDEEALFAPKEESDENTPWLVLPHESKELFTDLLRGLIRPIIHQEIAGAFQEVFDKDSNIYTKEKPTDAPETLTGTLDEQIRQVLQFRDYQKAVKWTYSMDHYLSRTMLIGRTNGITLRQLYIMVGDEMGISPKAIQLRWYDMQDRFNIIDRSVIMEEIIEGDK